MKPFKFVLLTLLFFGILLGGAVIWDSSRAVENAYEAFLTADNELKAQETKFINLIRSLPDKTTEVDKLIALYNGTQLRDDRLRVFDNLSIEAQRMLMRENNPSDPLRRRILDESAGILNRRHITERHIEDAQSQYNSTMSSFRGSITKALGSKLPDHLGVK